MNRTVKPGERSELAVMICVSAAYCCGYFGCLLSPVTSQLYQELAQAPSFWVNYVVSGALVISILFNFIAAFLARYISKKKLHLIALFLFSMGGMGFVFARNIYTYAISRTLCCVSMGIVFVTIPGMICELYEDARIRSKYFGMSNIVGTVIGMVFSLLAGTIAVRCSWHSVFYITLAGLFVMLLSIFAVPDRGLEVKRVEKKAEYSSSKEVNGPLAISFLAGQIAMNVFFGVMYYLSDLYSNGTGIGDSMLTGIQLAAGMLCGALMSASFAAVYRRLRRWTGVVGWLLMFLPFMMLGFKADALVFVVCGSLSIGMVSLNYLYYQQKFSEIAPMGKSTLFMSLNSAACVAGTSVSAYIPGLLRRTVGIQDVQEMYVFLSGCMLVCVIVSVACTLLIRDKTDNMPSLVHARRR